MIEALELSVWPIYASGFSDLEDELAGVRRRIARGRERADDRDDLEALETALAELRAAYRASLRVALELGDDAAPLDVALIQCEELIADKLTLRSIAPETREALRTTREADYAVVLYGLADPGGNSA